jgi:hypothetical protein
MTNQRVQNNGTLVRFINYLAFFSNNDYQDIVKKKLHKLNLSLYPSKNIVPYGNSNDILNIKQGCYNHMFRVKKLLRILNCYDDVTYYMDLNSGCDELFFEINLLNKEYNQMLLEFKKGVIDITLSNIYLCDDAIQIILNFIF